MQISEDEFRILVSDALDNLPEDFARHINNAAILVEDFPSPEQQQKLNIKSKYGLLGLFEGFGQAKRLNFGPVLPDRITLFRVPIMQSCSDREELQKEILKTLKHEIAHHFGSDEKGARKVSRAFRKRN